MLKYLKVNANIINSITNSNMKIFFEKLTLNNKNDTINNPITMEEIKKST